MNNLLINDIVLFVKKVTIYKLLSDKPLVKIKHFNHFTIRKMYPPHDQAIFC